MPKNRKRITPSVTVNAEIWQEFKRSCDELGISASRLLDKLMMIAVISTNVEELTPEQMQKIGETFQKQPHKGFAGAMFNGLPDEGPAFLNYVERMLLSKNKDLLSYMPNHVEEQNTLNNPSQSK